MLQVGALNQLEGVTCNVAEGALYAFPRVMLPDGAVAEAARLGAGRAVCHACMHACMRARM